MTIPIEHYPASALIGGGTGAVDKIKTVKLSDKDSVIVVMPMTTTSSTTTTTSTSSTASTTSSTSTTVTV